MSAFPALVVALLLLAPAAAWSQAPAVYRCADPAGQVTYQQEPCKSGSKGSTVEILPDNGRARDSAALEAEWSAAARKGMIALGMPRRYVRDALGAPAEMRQGLPVERATEIWTYRSGDAARRIGFLDGRVTWDRAGDGNKLDPPAPRVAQAPVPVAPAPAPVQAPPQILMAPTPAGTVQPSLPSPVASLPSPPAASPPGGVPQPMAAPAPRPAAPVSPPLPPGVQQDASGLIVMRRPDALPPDGAGAGQPAVRVLPLPPQVAVAPQAAPSPAPPGSPSGLPPLSSTAATWSPSGPAQGAAPPPAVPAASAPRTEAMMLARRSIRPGASCSSVLSQAGAPDRTDTIRVPAPGGGEVPAARHTYASEGSNPPRDIAFTCVGGIVREVERGVR